MDIAIIGAGLSGITLANELNEKGINTRVFEKSRGKGGRVNSKRLSFANVDMGAQYFTVRDERFELATERWKNQGHIEQWQFQPHIVDVRNNHPYLKDSPDDICRYVGSPTMNTFIKHQAQHLNVQLNTQIENITKNGEKWQLWSGGEDDKKLIGSFDWVVSTAPAEQSFELFKNTPEVQQRIPTPMHSPCWALVLATKGHVPEQIQGFFGDEDISWVSRDSSKPNRRTTVNDHLNEENRTEQTNTFDYDDIWVLHFSENWTNNNIQLSEEEMTSFGFNWLSNILSNTVMLQPKKYEQVSPIRLTNHHSYRHFWRYARFDEQNEIPNDIVYDAHHKVAIIGDWCYGGRVEKAYLAGLECAEQIMLEL